MVLSRAMVRASASGERTAEEVAKIANDLIAADSKSGMFVTLFYAILDQEARTLRYVNAGHNPPLVLSGDTGDLTLLKTRGIAMGVMEDAEMEERKIKLSEGTSSSSTPTGLPKPSTMGSTSSGSRGSSRL